MGNEVFANSREISCKSGDGKSICEFPDVCLTPPPNVPSPFGPGVPVPYPNTAFSKDTSNGTRTVKIDKKEVMQKNKSYYKTSTGDEAGCATAAKKGIITGKIKGKMYFISWSMDVKFEAQNIDRTGDMTTHNHGSNANGFTPTVDVEGVAPPAINADCQELANTNDNIREKLSESTTDKTLVGPEGQGKGTTISSAKFTSSDGATSILSAHNKQKANEKLPEHLVKGGKMEDRNSGKSQLCPEADFTHAKPCCQKSGHAEARILDEIGTKEGSLTLNIDWRPKTKPPSKMPCSACHKMICAAKKCNMEITICGKDGSKHLVPCPANKANYAKLKKKVDGR